MFITIFDKKNVIHYLSSNLLMVIHLLRGKELTYILGVLTKGGLHKASRSLALHKGLFAEPRQCELEVKCLSILIKSLSMLIYFGCLIDNSCVRCTIRFLAVGLTFG